MRTFTPILGLVACSTMPIMAQAQDQDGSFDLGTLTLGGLLTETEGVTEISEEELEQTQPLNVSDVLKREAGVTGISGPGGQFADVNIRGVDGAGAVIVSIDGAEKNQVVQSHEVNQNPVFLTTGFLKQVTVAKGPVSNTFGTGSVGGRVEFQTYDPSDLLPGDLSFGGQIEAIGTTAGDGGGLTGIFAQRPNDQVELLFGLSHFEVDNYEDGDGVEVINADRKVSAALFKLNYTPNDQVDIGFSYQISRTDYTGSGVVARAGRRSDSGQDTSALDSSFVLDGEYRFSNTLKFNTKLFHSRTGTDETSLVASGSGGTVPAGTTQSSDVRTTGLSAYGTYDFVTGAADHRLQFGLSYTANDLSYAASAGDPSETGGSRDTYGLFIQDDIRIGNWQILPGLRFEGYKTDTQADQTVEGTKILPKLTVAYNFPKVDGLELYGSYARGLRAPRLNELFTGETDRSTIIANPNLVAETSDAFELGARYNSGPFSGSLALFQTKFDNKIDRVDLASGDRQFQNVGKATIEGLELSLDYDVDRFFFGMSASITDGTDEAIGEDLNSVRPHSGVLYAGVRMMDGRFTLGAEAEFVGSKTEIGANQVVGDTSEAYEVLNLFGSYDINDQTAISGRINNITDETYRAFDQIDNSPGLNATLSLVHRF